MAKTINLKIFGEKFKATFSDEQETLLLTLLSERFKYQATIPNPDFDPGQPPGPSNPLTITNPESAQIFIAKAIVVDLTIGMQYTRVGKLWEQKRTEANTQGQSEFAGIIIGEDV